MNIMDLLNKREPLEGEFKLPSGEYVKGQIILDPQYDHSVILRVTTQQEHWTHPPDPKEAVIHGRLNNGMYLTLIGSTPTRSKYTPSLPHYDIYCQSLLTIRTHQTPSIDCCEVTKIRFKLPHSRQIFPIFMNRVHPENRHKILKKIIGDTYQPNDHEYSFDRIYYCGGTTEVISCDTSYGHVSVRPYEVTTLPFIDVEFIIELNPESSLSDAESAIECVTRFFWLITGARQYAENIRLDVRDPKDRTIHNLDVHFLLQEAPLFKEDDSTHPRPHTILINPIHLRQTIEKCLRNWACLSRHQRNACDIILSQFTESSHPPHRIARAAVAYERFGEISDEMEEADESTRQKKKIVKFAKEQIKGTFAGSEERDFILTQIGNIVRRRTLRNKINSRIGIIQDHLPAAMKSDIYRVARLAVSARNEYIHIDCISKQHGPTQIFYACTLEFIFLASVLVECGWDMKSYFKSPHTLSHPFNRYITDYSQLYDMCKGADPQSD